MENNSENLIEISNKLKKLGELKKELYFNELVLEGDKDILSLDIEQAEIDEKEKTAKYVNGLSYDGYFVTYNDAERNEIDLRMQKLKSIKQEINEKSRTSCDNVCPKERPVTPTNDLKKKLKNDIIKYTLICLLLLGVAIGLIVPGNDTLRGISAPFLIGFLIAFIVSIHYIKKANENLKNTKTENQSNLEYNSTQFPLEIEAYNQKNQELKQILDELEKAQAVLTSEIIEIHLASYREFMKIRDEEVKAGIPVLEQKIKEIRNEIDSEIYDYKNIRSFDYTTLFKIAKILDFGRADSYKDALNLFIQEQSDERFRNEMRSQAEEAARKQEQAQREMEWRLEQSQKEMELANQRQAQEQQRHNREMERAAKEQASYAKQQADKSAETIKNLEKELRNQQNSYESKSQYKGPYSGGINGDTTLCIGCRKSGTCSRLKCTGFTPQN